jgi:3-oxoacyl-[acyl-carrier protein] reductase
MADFVEKVVLVTGAGRGNGRAVAVAFAARGAILAANDLTPINLDETIRQILNAGGRARPYIFDVAKGMPVQAMVDQVLQDWGRIDILVNCAVVKPQASLLELDEWDWNRTLDVNLSGAFYTIQAVGRVMRRQGGGDMVNFVGPLTPTRSADQSAAYLASKMGLLGLTRAAALQLATDHIRVNAICLESSELEQPVSAERAADLALYLCSPAAAQLTGQVIFPDGSTSPC